MMQRLALVLGFFFFFSSIRAAEFFENASHSPHLDLIQSARSTIDIEIYTIQDPKIRSALLDALDRGVKVRILQEPAPVGSSCRVFESQNEVDQVPCSENKHFLHQVRLRGGTYLPFNKSAFCEGGSNCFEHGKLMIIDQRAALISTGNFDPTSICNRNKRCVVRII